MSDLAARIDALIPPPALPTYKVWYPKLDAEDQAAVDRLMASSLAHDKVVILLRQLGCATSKDTMRALRSRE